MRLRKKSVILAISVILMLIFTGCGNNIAGKSNSDKIKVVCTIFPQYDWVREIIADTDNVEISLLVDNGVDLHSYQPTADDIITISECDVFIYVGGESDKWVKGALSQASNKDMIVINMMEILGDSVKAEEIIEGMDSNHDHDHEHDEENDEEHEHDEDHDEEHEHDENHDEEHEHDNPDMSDDKDVVDVEYDEHIWLSLRNASVLCEYITDVISEEDSKNKDIYENNMRMYIEKLNKLDDAYKEVVQNAKYDTVLFGDRFPFRYLINDYGLNYYAAFVGCSAETEASFETVTFLAGKLNELDLSTVLVVEGSNESLAETIILSSEKKDQAILIMNSMQSVTEKDIDSGATYISIMEENLSVFKQALE